MRLEADKEQVVILACVIGFWVLFAIAIVAISQLLQLFGASYQEAWGIAGFCGALWLFLLVCIALSAPGG